MIRIKSFKNRILKSVLSLVILSLGFSIEFMKVNAETNTLQEFADTYSHVSLSPDGTAWTIEGTGSAEENVKHHKLEVGTPNLKQTGEGEHYYYPSIIGNVNIWYWEVMHPWSVCTHGHEYVGQEHYGLTIEGDICWEKYDCGWFPVCADCGDYIFEVLVYANSEQLRDIKTMVGKGKYYFLCPHSGSLEVGASYEHRCRRISYNRYKVAYDANPPLGTTYRGATAKTFHMYNNADMYEGNPATYKDTHLRKNGYSITGYKFIGWNDKPDGSGNFYRDEQEVLNLCDLTEEDRNNENIVLYAQWEKVDTTLTIDANGGTYDGLNEYSITQPYGSSFTLEKEKVVAPSGYTITFNSHGGTSCADQTTEKEFAYWEKQPGFEGLMLGNIYFFKSMTNGHEDVIKIQYSNRAITLPNTTQSSLSFAGWYYDEALTDFCGMAGDKVAFDEDLELHAKWMPLTLYSEPVYDSTVNDGKGAVNLWWEQKDNNQKIYKLYQSLDKINWTSLIDTSAVANVQTVNETFSPSNWGMQYVIPATGYYEINAYGAKGGDYSDAHKGGKGGKVAATYWLKKGDIITTYAGTSGNGQKGGVNSASANGGTSTSANARGGGAGTEVHICRDGVWSLLMLAGGGGGANATSSGGNGGEAIVTISDPVGDSTAYGGGGGGLSGGTKVSKGLTAGKAEPAEFFYTGGVRTFAAPYTATYKLEAYGAQGGTVNANTGGLGGYSVGKYDLKQGDVLYVYVGGMATGKSGGFNGGGNGGFPADGAANAFPGGGGGGATHIATTDRGSLANYEAHQDELILVAGGGGGATNQTTSMVWSGGAGGGLSGGEGISIDYEGGTCSGGSQTTGYAFGQGMTGSNGINAAWSWSGSGGGGGGYYGGFANDGTMHNRYNEKNAASGAGGSGYIDGVRDGSTTSGVREGNGYAVITCEVVESFYMSGGSSYVCQEYNAKNLAYNAGINSGDGYVTIVSKGIGYYENTCQNGVIAPDTLAPYPVDRSTTNVVIADIANDSITYNISFRWPEDRGTDYYHKVESYLLSSEDKLSISNITEDLILTRYKGVHFYVDESPIGQVTNLHELCTTNIITHTGEDDKTYYLHMAAVDNAGNISETIDIKLSPEESDDIIAENFIPVTDSIGIKVSDSNGALEKSPLYFYNNCYFVRADGETNFTLTGTAHIKNHMERDDYQVNTIQFNLIKSITDSVTEWVKGRVSNGKNTTYGNTDIALENYYLEQYIQISAASAFRNEKMELTLNQEVSFIKHAASTTFLLYPKAYAEYLEDGAMKEIGSNDSDDRTKYVTIVTDSVAPIFTGVDELCACDPINMSESSKTFIIEATDDCSGVGEFTVTINNLDNMSKKVIKDEDDGVKDGAIFITVPRYYEGSKEGVVFRGAFEVTAYAVDNVGNKRLETYDAVRTSLDASVMRILEPHEPIFKRGESGILSIDTWGYVEKVDVEFQGALAGLNTEYNYGTSQYQQGEQLEFMIPLDCPDGEYQVKVTGYKSGTDLENHWKILFFTVKGSVLDELRTRLR